MAKKYYAVKAGRNPGVYDSWNACKEQVDGFSGAQYKSFKEKADAEAYAGVQEQVMQEQAVTEQITEQKETFAEFAKSVRDDGRVLQIDASEPMSVIQSKVQNHLSKPWGTAYIAICKNNQMLESYQILDMDGKHLGSGQNLDVFFEEKDPMYGATVADICRTIQQDYKTSKPEKRMEHGVEVSDTPYAFVDGSFNPETGVYGYGGFLCVNGRKFLLMGSSSNPELASMRNVAGELEGAMAAVKKAEELKLTELKIFYDYRGIEEWATGGWKTNKAGTKAYAQFMNPDNRSCKVSFEHVYGHTGIEGNEMVDVMAKRAVGVPLGKAEVALYQKAVMAGRRDGIPCVEITTEEKSAETQLGGC